MQSLNSLDKLISLQYLTSIIPSSGNGIRNIGDSSGDSIGKFGSKRPNSRRYDILLIG